MCVCVVSYAYSNPKNKWPRRAGSGRCLVNLVQLQRPREGSIGE